MLAPYKKKLVGALTSKPFAFTARSWEVVMVPSIDTYDSFLGSLRLDFRNNDLLRILPLINEDLNEEWLTDKARFSYDGLKRQRFLQPYARVFGLYSASDDGAEIYFKSLVSLHKLQIIRPVSKDGFFSSFLLATRTLTAAQAVVFFGKEVDIETALSARLALEGRFKEVVYRNGDYSNFSDLNPDLLRFAIDPNLFLASSSLLLVGSNLRWELPLLNIKVMRRVFSGALSVFTVAVRSVFSFPVTNLSSNAQKFLTNLVSGRSKLFLKLSNPFIALSYSLADYAPLVSSIRSLTVGVVFPWASTVSLLEVCPAKAGKEIQEQSLSLAINSDVLSLPSRGVSVGLLSHGHSAHSNLDFIFPCSAYSESNSHYFNVFRSERYARFGYALSKGVLPSWASLFKLFKLGLDALVLSSMSLDKVCFSTVVSKPFGAEEIDRYAAFYLNKPTMVSLLRGGLFYEVTPNYYRTHYVSRNSKPTSLAAARFSLTLSNFVIK